MREPRWKDAIHYVRGYREGLEMVHLDYNLTKVQYVKDESTLVEYQSIPDNTLWNKFSMDFDAYSKTYILKIKRGTIKNNYDFE